MLGPLTSLGHIHHLSELVHSHGEDLAGEQLRVPGPAQVQLVGGPELKRLAAGAERRLRAQQAVQHQQDHE